MNKLNQEAKAIALEVTALINSKSKLGELNEIELTKEVVDILTPIRKVYLINSSWKLSDVNIAYAATNLDGISKILVIYCKRVGKTVIESSIIVNFEEGEIEFQYYDHYNNEPVDSMWYLTTIEII